LAYRESGETGTLGSMPADASPPLDPVALIEGLTELVDLVNAGQYGPSTLQLTVELAATATGAMGASFIEYTESGGRTVATTSELAWALGRPIDVADPRVARVLAGPRVQQSRLDDLPSGSAGLLRSHGMHRMLTAIATVHGSLVGSLHAYFPDRDGAADPVHVALLRLLAAGAAHLYGSGTGLPVYPDGLTPVPAHDGLAVVGPDGIVRSWSPAAERLTGRPAAKVIGAPVPFPMPGTGETIVHRLEPGRRVQIRTTSLVGSDASVLIFREPAESHEREQGRDLFIAMTSHELRTPVTVIKGYADTLAERWDSLTDQARRDAVFVVWQRSRELARLVDRLLTAASDVAGLPDSSSRLPFEPAGALREAAAELPADLRRDLRVNLPGELPKVRGDRASLATVLTELVMNASKYSPERVDVELTAGADARTVWIRVDDRGLGIRPEHAERAFERFWQLERGDQRRYGGVGLGLYLVRRIVERQNGWVSLRPREGGGTVAEVRLPRVDAGEAD
jgi:two-component system phosphate regulon sensor histidine kinase PhoR